ncbi:hypothetical protein BDP27DRAFT_1445975 [Rhodocollybia butyracea]|uniref:Uncharacterized protein n=1 Tax=Rhodocollybia butyracea TaxID=206335 RepID=A0A9P5UAF6_9AGAR|nr:hypothetical protein BDP27DRAFT_1445975 [Rhodocollybia butyracea]
MDLRIYVALLVSSVVATLLPELLEPLSPRLADITRVLFVVWIPSSIYLSFRLLCRIIGQIPAEQLLPLRVRSRYGIERRVPERLEHYITLITYGHTWLMLGYLLDVIHPLGFIQLAIMLVYTLITVVAFGKCLLIAGIDQNYWGHFFDLYTLSDLFLCISIRVFRKVVTLFS